MLEGNKIQDGKEIGKMLMKDNFDSLNIEYWDYDDEVCVDVRWLMKLQIKKLNCLSMLENNEGIWSSKRIKESQLMAVL